MRKSTVIWVLLVAFLSLYAAAQHFNAAGSDELLDAIQSIRNGSTQDEVRRIMGREPNVKPARRAPAWIKNVVPPTDVGEYWHYYMGYPPRNLIIYFDEHGLVVFTTWTPT